MRRLLPQVGLLVTGLFVGTLVGVALDRSLVVLTANYPEAPVTLERAELRLVETFTGPTQLPPLPDLEIPRSRVRYLNVKNRLPLSYAIEGQVTCRNRTQKVVEAVQLTTIVLNPFRERLRLSVVTLRSRVAPRDTESLSWSETFGTKDAEEVRLAITAVRFSDGTVWTAPDKDLFVWPE